MRIIEIIGQVTMVKVGFIVLCLDVPHMHSGKNVLTKYVLAMFYFTTTVKGMG